MINENYILTNNFEQIGDFFLEKGITLFNENNYKASYEFFKLALEFKSCFNEVLVTKHDYVKKVFIQNFEQNNSKEELFSISFTILFFEPVSLHFLALKYIDKYLLENDDFYGNLIRTIILTKNNSIENYLIEESFSKMNSFKKNNFYLNYLISFNSRQNNKNYAELIHDNFIKNYTSYNSLYLLDEIYLKCNNSKLLKIDKENFKNVLIRFFYNKKRKTETFISFFKEFVNRTVDKNNQLNYNIIKLLNEFVIVIKNNKDVFIEIENTTESFYYLELMEEEDRISDLIEEYNLDLFEMSNGIAEDDYYNDNLDLDQQDPKFWDNL